MNKEGRDGGEGELRLQSISAIPAQLYLHHEQYAIHDFLAGLMDLEESISVLPMIWTHLPNKAKAQVGEQIGEIHVGIGEFLDAEGKNIMHLAVEHRGEKVFLSLRSVGTLVYSMVMGIDRLGNSFLHFAGKLGKCQQSKALACPQHMQRELFCFKVKYAYHLNDKDTHDQTAQELFTATHGRLVKEGEVWLKKGAQSWVIVTILIIACQVKEITP
ncbi:uncharacterized protein LOC105421661 [Amborella trichopoda]|uniref:uncharacterized protein LOC105421661 n=1 Tax=Amborella trichopoda TaxID=13333 RepID=UPI0009C13902|nr:uncharacterized protein LOC105421661 [Amborella trichopoda]|eukprot:XP_020530993.1 uncharacterized protein LOC105421661 [Amborella trichopoda]